MNNVDCVIRELAPSPTKPAIRLIWNVRRPALPFTTVIDWIALAPLLEAIAAHLQKVRAEAVGPDGRLLNEDRLMDLHGLLVFLNDLLDGAPGQVRADSRHLLLAALHDLEPYLDEIE